MINASAYNISVRHDDFDGEMLFEARVKELPDVVEYASTFEEAYSLALDTVNTTIQALYEMGKDMPAPYSYADDFSGRLTLRVPRSLHRAIVEAAEDEGVSINQHIVNILGYFSGYAGVAGNSSRRGWQPSGIARPVSSGRDHLRLVRSTNLAREVA